jgi:hypothetical protein
MGETPTEYRQELSLAIRREAISAGQIPLLRLVEDPVRMRNG